MNPLSAFFEEQVARHADRPAVQMRPRYRTIRWSYRELDVHVKRLAGALADRGIGPGDRVLLFSANSPYWIAAFFAILARDAVAVPLNPQSAPEQLDRIVNACEPKLLLKSARLPWPAAPLPAIEMEHIGTPAKPTKTHEASPITHLAEIVYTSGTTGEPKGVMLTHDNLLSNLNAISHAVPMERSGMTLSIVPLFHMYGQLAGMLYPLKHGAAVSYLPSLSSRAILEAFRDIPATHLVAVPEFLKTVMERVEERLAPVPPFLRTLLRPSIRARISKTLRTVACGGAPLDPEIEKTWRDLGFVVLQGYGLTETSPVVTSNTREDHRIGSVGKPLEDVAVKLAPDGEILVKGPNVMAGYFRDAKRTQETFEDGWFKTDDIGRLDEDGYLYVSGRKKYMLLGPGGENVYPEDLEAELNRCPGVKDSAVVGLEKQGRVLIHAVLLCDACDGDAIVASANRRLAPHQRIQAWSRWPEADFPRSATRKIKKEDVLKRLRSRAPDRAERLAAPITPLVRLLADVARRDPAAIRPDTRIVPELALDSLLRIELVSRMEEQWGVSIEERVINAATTVGELEKLVARTKPRRPRLAAFPRWPVSPWANAVRPLVRGLFFDTWLSALAPRRITGLERLKRLEGPVIFMANHRSFLDAPLIVRALPWRFRKKLGIAAATNVLYAKYRWFAPLAELAFNAYPFPTEADENIQKGLDDTGRLLDAGWNALLFPEGGLNRSGDMLLPLKNGAGAIASEMRAPVVPVVILGSEIILPPDTLFPRRRRAVEIRFGQPMRFDDATRSYAEITQDIERAMRRLIHAQSR